jgi:hypothetical protein
VTKRRRMGSMFECPQPREQHAARPGSSSIVCPRRRREDEAEKTGDSSARRHPDGVEMSRHCTDWPRTLGQQPSPILHGMAFSLPSTPNGVCLRLRGRRSREPVTAPSHAYPLCLHCPSRRYPWMDELWPRGRLWRGVRGRLSAATALTTPTRCFQPALLPRASLIKSAREWLSVLASPSFHPDSLNHPFAQSVEGDLGAPDHAAWRSPLAAGLDDAHLSAGHFGSHSGCQCETGI